MKEPPTFYGHITKEQLEGFHRNQLAEHDFISLISHASTCDYCATTLADNFPNDQLIQAPKDLKSSILIESRRINTHLIGNVKKTTKQLQLFLYSLKVTAAVLGSLYLLFMGLPDMRILRIQQEIQYSDRSIVTDIQEHSQKITTAINQILQTEANQYD